MECYNFDTWGRHASLLPWVCLSTLVYVIGIPVLFATMLFSKRKVRGDTTIAGLVNAYAACACCNRLAFPQAALIGCWGMCRRSLPIGTVSWS